MLVKMKTKPILIYITAGNLEEAKSISVALLDLKLVACANISGPVTSLYLWQGERHENEEWTIIAKTTEACQAGILELVGKIHSYQCPCVVAIPLTGGNPAFLEWVASETATPRE